MSLEKQILDILVKHKRREFFNDSDFVVPELLALIETERTKTVKEFAVFILNNVNTSTAGIMTSFKILIDKFLNTKTDKLPEGE